MRKQQQLVSAAASACVMLLAACGGGGGAAVPATAPFIAAGSLPSANSGIIPATGSVTLFTGGSMIGSAVAPNAAAAIFTVDSGTTPKKIAVGGTLTSYPLHVSDVEGSSSSALLRRASFGRRTAWPRDPDLRIPDAPGDADLRRHALDLQRRSAASLRTVAALPTLRRAQSIALGARHTFALQGGTINGSGGSAQPIAMPATLVAQSAHANVWLDDTVARNPVTAALEFPSGAADFGAVARQFETTFALETRVFGPAYTTSIVNFEECDASGAPLASSAPRPDTTGASDPHINIVITDALAGSGEGGYFYGLDLLSQAEANCVSDASKPTVNGMPMFVIESDSYPPYAGGPTATYPANNEAYWLQGDMPQTIAHEFQHYLHFVNKYLQQHIDHADNADGGTLDDSYIDEGCSMLAQDLVAGDALGQRETPAFVRAFLLEPGDFSLTAFSGYQPNALDSASANPPYAFYRNTAGNYGQAYLFVRYLYDRFGAGALHAIYAETNFGDAADPDTGPASAAAGGEPFVPLFREFTTAVAIHSGGNTPELSTAAAYHFDASVILRGPVQTYSRRLAPYNVRTIVQPGPLNPELFTSGVPSAPLRLGAAQAADIMLLDGGALFISPQQPWTHGATLSAGGSIAGGGSLGQGALPAPTPADY